jgi:hypothetical protein
MLIVCSTDLKAQVDTARMQLHHPERWAAYEAIHNLKDDGILVVRLDTRTRKLAALDAVLANPNLKAGQRKRAERQRDYTIEDRDQTNAVMGEIFRDSFRFAPIYFVYDTNSHHLGTEAMIDHLVDWNGNGFEPAKIDSISQEHIFLVDYRVGGGTYPYDVLLMRRLEAKLADPFPTNAPVRSSFVNDKYAVLKKSVQRLDNRLFQFYERMQAP